MKGMLGGRWTSHEYIGGWNTMEYLLMDGVEIFTHGILTKVYHLWFHTWFIQHSFTVA